MTCRRSLALSIVLGITFTSYTARIVAATSSSFSCYPAETPEVAGAESCPGSLDGSDLISVIMNHNLENSGGNVPNAQLSCEYEGGINCDYMVPDLYAGLPFLTDTTGGWMNPDYCPSELAQSDQGNPATSPSVGGTGGSTITPGDDLGSPTLNCPATVNNQPGTLSSIIKGEAAQDECDSSICYNCLYESSISCFYNISGDLQSGSSEECPTELTCPAVYPSLGGTDSSARRRSYKTSAYVMRQVDTRKLRSRLEAGRH